MCGGSYPTRLLADSLRGRKLLSLERAVQALTEVPARHLGLRDRGQVKEGWIADLVVFDPATVDTATPTIAHDLPGGSPRMHAESVGIVRVFVGGVVTVTDGASTGARPGTVLRSGRDTDTVTVH
jgi:N-acyl-D-aspartate/D-glutamate deacylase